MWRSRAALISLFVLLLYVLAPQAAVKPLHAAESDILITGRVTSEADGAPIPDVQVALMDGSYPLEGVVGAHTDSSGYYTVTTTPYTTWWIRFFPPDETHLQEFYDNFYISVDDFSKPQGAEKFVYAPGLQRSGINAALAVRGDGQIVGTVAPASPELSSSWVVVETYVEDGPEDARWFKQQDISASGHYTVTDLAPGRYKLYFHVQDNRTSTSDVTYASEYYNNQATLDAAAWIEVGAGEVAQAEPVELQLGGIITGVVRSSLTGQALEWIRTYAYDTNNRLVTFNDNSYIWEGDFRVTNLPPGQYKLYFQDLREQHRAEFYDERTRVEDAKLVSVQAGEVTQNIVAELAFSHTVVSLATSPGLPNALMLSFANDPVPRFTTDGGEHWQKMATTPWVAPGHTPAIFEYAEVAVGLAPRPNLGGHRLIYVPHNLYRSGDAGQTWATQKPLRECSGVSQFRKLYAVPTDPNRLYALEHCSVPNDWAGSLNYDWLVVSRDAGVTWQPLSIMHDGIEIQNIQSVVVSPHVADRLYVYAENQGWLRSDDGGEHWVHLDFTVQALQLDAEDEDTLYGMSSPFDLGGWFALLWGQRSEDGGETWEDWEEQPCSLGFKSLVAHPTEAELLFLRCDTGLYRSNNGGDEWTQLAAKPGGLLVPDYGVPGRLLWAKEDALWASTDEGDSWQVLMPDYASVPAQVKIPLYLPNIAAPGFEAEE